MLKHEYAVPKFVYLSVLVGLASSRIGELCAKFLDFPILTPDRLRIECTCPVVGIALHLDSRGRLRIER